MDHHDLGPHDPGPHDLGPHDLGQIVRDAVALVAADEQRRTALHQPWLDDGYRLVYVGQAGRAADSITVRPYGEVEQELFRGTAAEAAVWCRDHRAVDVERVEQGFAFSELAPEGVPRGLAAAILHWVEDNTAEAGAYATGGRTARSA